jgi:NAD(P)-dependent dehydrogenase (short-subunit alcohol dehydrogenase family)
MDLGLEGKVALVTGASQGMGLCIARALAAEGAQVAERSRSQENIEPAAAEVGARAYVHDMTNLDDAPARLGVDRRVFDEGPPGAPLLHLDLRTVFGEIVVRRTAG